MASSANLDQVEMRWLKVSV